VKIFDPTPYRNDYLSKVFFEGIMKYAVDNSIVLETVDSTDDLKNSILLINAEHLTVEKILQIKNNGNKIVAFDVNDSSYLSGRYRHAPEADLIDIVFTLSGIQKTNSDLDLTIDSSFRFSLRPIIFLPDKCWLIYKSMADAGRIRGLPYVPWNHYDAPQRTFQDRNGKILISGSNQFYRFLLFLNLMKMDILDPSSMFDSSPYFEEGMRLDMRYCESCRNNRRAGMPEEIIGRPEECNSSSIWGDHFILDTYQNANQWNNRCPKSFLWLTRKFIEAHGKIDQGFTWNALNGTRRGNLDFASVLSNARFFADFKWVHSIYAPPRFWESANSGTINLLPRRAANQTYFPEMKEGDHFVTFAEDFSDLSNDVSEGDFNHITSNCLDLYRKWIKPGQYKISDALCQHILSVGKELS